MSDETERKTGLASRLGKRVIGILVGLVITLIVGAIAERVTSPEWLAEAKEAILAQDDVTIELPKYTINHARENH